MDRDIKEENRRVQERRDSKLENFIRVSVEWGNEEGERGEEIKREEERIREEENRIREEEERIEEEERKLKSELDRYYEEMQRYYDGSDERGRELKDSINQSERTERAAGGALQSTEELRDEFKKEYKEVKDISIKDSTTKNTSSIER